MHKTNTPMVLPQSNSKDKLDGSCIGGQHLNIYGILHEQENKAIESVAIRNHFSITKNNKIYSFVLQCYVDVVQCSVLSLRSIVFQSVPLTPALHLATAMFCAMITTVL